MILCILYKCHMGYVKKCSISLRLYLKSLHNGNETGSFSKSLLRRREKMAIHGSMENDVVDNETLAVLCSVLWSVMHKLIKNLLMPKKST